MHGHGVRKVVKVAVLGVVAVTVFGFVLMGLWNWLVPPLFGAPVIGFWQALGLFFLSKLLFGGFHGGGSHRRWRRGMRERWAQMTPEERERFRAGLRGCGPEPKPAERG